MNTEAVRRALLVVMFIGAARADATPAQVARLQNEVLPALKNPAASAREAYRDAVLATAAVMGPQWRPAGKWDDQIQALLKEEAAP